MDQHLELTCNTQIKVEPEDKSYEEGYKIDLKVKDEISTEEDNLPENFVSIKLELPDNLSIKVEHVDIDYDEGSFEEKEKVPEEMIMKVDPSCNGNDHYNKSAFELELKPSRIGTHALHFNGYRFNKKYEGNSTTRWRCIKHHKGCKAFVVTAGNRILNFRQHNHENIEIPMRLPLYMP